MNRIVDDDSAISAIGLSIFGDWVAIVVKAALNRATLAVILNRVAVIVPRRLG